MGYYDQDNENRYKKQKGNKGGYFLASLVGAIIGVILMVIALPTLSNWFPSTSNNGIQTTDQKTLNKSVKNVSINAVSGITQAVDKVRGAVVNITNIQATSFWAEGDTTGRGQQEAGTGSGVIYKSEGGKAYIVTNNHVVEGAKSLEVTLNDGTKLPATLRGKDPWTDLAVIEVDGKKIQTVAEFGDSDALKLGEPAIAIGNPLGPTFSGSVTEGIISGLERTIPVDINGDGVADWQAEVIQTDAAINPGNSGGALVNISGQVVGINSMKIAQQSVEGIGLSIPINTAKPIINELEKFGQVKRPYMGVDLKSVNEIPAYYQQEALKLPNDVNYGVAIRQVVPASPAAQAGLKELDVIVELDGKKINDVIDLRKYMYNQKKVGDRMTIKYYRNGKLRETTVKLSTEKQI